MSLYLVGVSTENAKTGRMGRMRWSKPMTADETITAREDVRQNAPQGSVYSIKVIPAR